MNSPRPLRSAAATLGLAVVLWGSPAEAEPWTLDRALDYALANSPDARIAGHRVAAAQAAIAQANAALWPQLQVQSSYIRTDNPMMTFGSILNQRSFGPSLNFNDVPDVDNLNLRGSVAVPLYAGGRIRAGREAAVAQTESAKASAAGVRQKLEFEVARSFHTAQKTRELIGAAEAAVAAFEQQRAVASNRWETGAALKIDVLDAQVRLAQAREDLARIRHAHALALRALHLAVGLPADAPEISPTDSTPLPSIPSARDFSARPELRAVQEAERAAAARVQAAKSGYRPQVNAFGQVDWDRGWVQDGDGASYTAGVAVQWDLWDGQRTRGRVREAQAQLEAVREEARKLNLAIGFEVEQASRQLQEAEERLHVTTLTIGQADESVALTRARFEQGLALSTQLVDAQTALTVARIRRAEAEADRRIAIAALRQALGLPQLDSAAPSSSPAP